MILKEIQLQVNLKESPQSGQQLLEVARQVCGIAFFAFINVQHVYKFRILHTDGVVANSRRLLPLLLL